MSANVDYVVGLIKDLDTKIVAEMKYSFKLEEEIERLNKKIKKLEEKLANKA